MARKWKEDTKVMALLVQKQGKLKKIKYTWEAMPEIYSHHL